MNHEANTAGETVALLHPYHYNHQQFRDSRAVHLPSWFSRRHSYFTASHTCLVYVSKAMFFASMSRGYRPTCATSGSVKVLHGIKRLLNLALPAPRRHFLKHQHKFYYTDQRGEGGDRLDPAQLETFSHNPVLSVRSTSSCFRSSQWF